MHAIALAVIDDGEGFDLDGKRSGVGLHSMRERAESLGGSLSIESVPGEGTRISCLMPFDMSEKGRQRMSHE
jgi:signal transduction histidine kinase